MKNGRSAQLEIIIDQTDPSVAQITRESTQLFVQALSQRVEVQRIAALAQKAQQDAMKSAFRDSSGYESYYNANITPTSSGAASLLTQSY